MSQNVNVNLTPGGYPKEFHVSQYDVGRQLVAKVVDSTGDYSIPSGATVVLVGTKPSGFGFTLNGTVSGSTVTFSTTATVTAEYGRIPCEIRITNGSTILGTANCMLVVEMSPHPEGTTDGDGEQIIPELTLLVQRVEAAAESIHDLSVSATTLPAGSAATATYNSTTNNINFGIPRGADGEVTRAELNGAISDLQSEINYTVAYEKDFTPELIEGSYIKTAVDVGNIVDLTPVENSSFAHIVIPCLAGANFVITGSSGLNPRLWAFVDKDDKMLAFASSSITGSDLEVTAPSGTAKAIFNVALYASRSIVQKNVLLPVKDYVDDNISDVTDEAESVSEIAEKNGEALSQVTLTSRQLFDRYAITENKAYSTDGQSIVDDSTKCLSDFIPIEAGARYTILACVGKLLFFSVDKRFITAYSASSYETAQNTTAPATAYYLRLEMNKYFYPYAQTMVVKGTSLGKDIRYGALVNEDKIESKREYEFSDIQIPKEYSAIGVKAVDGTQDFDDENPSVSQLYDAYDALMADFPNYITKEDFGMDESNTYHMYAYYFTPEDVPTEHDMYRKPYPKVNLRSGIHGNGTLGDSNINLFCLYYLMKSICYNWRESEALEYLRWNVRFAILPLQNPWGFENKKRFNSNGVDINRNFSVGWQLGTSGNPDYGGASPLSESETNNIIAFEQANADAIFTIDVHSQSQAPQQSQMSYNSLFATSEMFYSAKSLVTKISHVWDSQNIPNLQKMNFHGYVACEFTGWGTGTSYIPTMIGTPAWTLEGFKNFANSSYTNGSVEVVKMVADQLGYGVLLGLNHFK